VKYLLRTKEEEKGNYVFGKTRNGLIMRDIGQKRGGKKKQEKKGR